MHFKPKHYGLILLVSFCILIVGYYLSNKENKTLATSNQTNKVETILFSNNQYLNTEKNYYNALLDIQNKFPKEVNSFQIVFQSENEDVIKKYRISKFPTLLIVDNNKVLVRIEGNQPEESIFKKIENVYKK